MTAAANPTLEPGRVYRTKNLQRWGRNPTRLAARLVREGKLVRLGHGLFSCPRQTRWGDDPPTDEQVLRAFLGSREFVFTGPYYWNALGLGTTQLFAQGLVYNRKRSGVFRFGNQSFRLRRIPFPRPVTAEWLAVDLLRNATSAGEDAAELSSRLPAAVAMGRLDRRRLLDTVRRFGTPRTRALVGQAFPES